MFVDGFLHKAPHLGVAQLRLGLPFELGFSYPHRDHGGQAFTAVVTGEVLFFLFEQLVLAGVLIHQGGQRRPETFFVGAALDGVNGVCERVYALGIAGVPLHGHLDLKVLALDFQADDRGVDRRLGLIQMLHIVLQPIGVVEGLFLFLLFDGFFLGSFDRGLGVAFGDFFRQRFQLDFLFGGPLVGERDSESLVQERHLL